MDTDRNTEPKEGRNMTRTGRGPTGRLRNFAAMLPGKLADVTETVILEANDPEAIRALAIFQPNRVAALAMYSLARTLEA
jgi:hypothetical protein